VNANPIQADSRVLATNSWLRTKPVADLLAETQHTVGRLKRCLSLWDLTALGIGAIIGAGVFVLTGSAAADKAGPAIMLSFVVAGLACICSALCYAEFAARLPVAGSAYTYAYASLGELPAWMLGWALILEYTLGASAVAVGWGEYLKQFLLGYGLVLPEWLSHIPIGSLHLNLLPVLLITLLASLIMLGIKASARFNTVMVVVKIGIILLVITLGVPWVRPEHWTPFFPYGVQGVFNGAALIFFAYLGFDALSTASEEVEHPERDLPRGILASLVICTILYIAVSAVITGMVPYQLIDRGAPLAAAFGSVGMPWAQQVIGLGGVVGLTTVVLILLMSQPRIFYAMARDGLLPKAMGWVHPQFGTPVTATIVTALMTMTLAGFVPMVDLHHTVSMGTLLAFMMVCISVLILRAAKGKPATFACPWVPWIPLLGIMVNGYMMASLPMDTWLRVLGWMVVGALIYGTYGYRHSSLHRQSP
jgi:APA family basic amino acid/polyamine antiporter